ncbi:protein of unknown function DUF541 [Anaeromyxobacter sp. K]|uniref:SIMPL domain-containing protein n=1 Tax=Anaeromyxobacter sp. (strain K) TaxID=447217 RepID=UPI00015F892F|nr:SIMPL domain-containing protein [Anaeromyxobacter sp. K]ACG73033.1 protein of unknown function DUF541 [Anaeromyxobacter sp. K]
MFRTLALATALALAPTAPGAQPVPAGPAPATAPSPRVIAVSGEGHVSVRPDVAVLFAGVTATGKDLRRVTADTDAQLRRILDALARAGVAEKDVQTARHDVSVDRDWNVKGGGPGPITGYTVTDELRVKVRDLAALGTVIERVLAAGTNTLRSLAFEKEDPTPEQARALAAAYATARFKAEAIARAAGVTLGEVLTVSEGGEVRPFPVMRDARVMSMKAEAAPVAAGEVEVAATVSVTFAIR